MIRCASVSTYMGPYISNYVLSELALLRKYRQQGDELIHIFPDDVAHKPWAELFQREGAKVYYIPYAPMTPRSIATLRRIFSDEHINFIHCHFGGWDLDARLAAPLTPMIWHQRMYVNLDTATRRLKYRLKYNVLGAFRTRHIAISEAVYEAITSITHHKTYCIPDGIDFDRLHPDNSRRLARRVADEPCRILLFGYSPKAKGVDIAIRACQRLIDHHVNVELRVVSQAVSDRYFAENFPNRPEWLRVLPPTDNVSGYYNDADIFLSASRSEGFSNSLLEAIYCGCPAVFSDIAGTRWARRFGHTFEYAVESPESLATAITTALDRPITPDVIERNRRMAVEQYSINTWVEQVYNTVKAFHHGK